MKISFFGHRSIMENDKVEKQLSDLLRIKINESYDEFLIGTHGDFDEIVFKVCKNLKEEHPSLKIKLVFTSTPALNKFLLKSGEEKNENIYAIKYDVEQEHFKSRITISNCYMVDESDLVICYVNIGEKNSGALKTIKYALKKGKEVINIY